MTTATTLPTHHPLSAAALAHVRARLEREIAKLRRTATRRDDVPEVTNAPDPMDRASALSSRIDDETTRTKAQTSLAEHQAALARLERTPTLFGQCERCGGSIPEERLDIVPTARVCMQCD